jgi:hypothetical protein
VGVEKALHDAVLISFPPVDPKTVFTIRSDASADAIGGVVSYINDKGVDVPIGFFSRSLKDYEQRYNTTKRELLSIVYGVHKFEHYLLNRDVKVYTDHISLVFPNGIKNKLTRTELSWWLLLSRFKLSFYHIPGSENIMADYLSRSGNDPTVLSDELSDASAFLTVVSNESEDEAPESIPNYHDYTELQKLDFVRDLHYKDHGHAAVLERRLKLYNVNWSNDEMHRLCTQVVSSCSSCQAFNPTWRKYDYAQTVVANTPMSHTQFDIGAITNLKWLSFCFGLLRCIYWLYCIDAIG